MEPMASAKWEPSVSTSRPIAAVCEDRSHAMLSPVSFSSRSYYPGLRTKSFGCSSSEGTG